jgi:hypothetical protein
LVATIAPTSENKGEKTDAKELENLRALWPTLTNVFFIPK